MSVSAPAPIVIALLVPVCSRGQRYTALQDCPLLKYSYPSLREHYEDGYVYRWYIGYDDDDQFYLEHEAELKDLGFLTHKLTGCQHAPATAWSKLLQIAYADVTIDYFFQLGDDVIMKSNKWASKMVNKLRENNDIGAVGPIDPVNYYGRIRANKPRVLENACVSRKHYDIFGYFFHPAIKNWYCDNWITAVYDSKCVQLRSIEVENMVRDNRYTIMQCPLFDSYVQEGKELIKKYLQ